MDLKEKYQTKAEELAIELHGKEYEELREVTQDIIYEKAIEMVGEELQERADNMREELQSGGI